MAILLILISHWIGITELVLSTVRVLLSTDLTKNLAEAEIFRLQ